ncbi:hypothetical protein C8R43DRAFT_942511 [Mycena crocata]|nr:hypothetical protein C8R43DRAFT_942511 [Mycena crocata]
MDEIGTRRVGVGGTELEVQRRAMGGVKEGPEIELITRMDGVRGRKKRPSCPRLATGRKTRTSTMQNGTPMMAKPKVLIDKVSDFPTHLTACTLLRPPLPFEGGEGCDEDDGTMLSETDLHFSLDEEAAQCNQHRWQLILVTPTSACLSILLVMPLFRYTASPHRRRFHSTEVNGWTLRKPTSPIVGPKFKSLSGFRVFNSIRYCIRCPAPQRPSRMIIFLDAGVGGTISLPVSPDTDIGTYPQAQLKCQIRGRDFGQADQAMRVVPA